MIRKHTRLAIAFAMVLSLGHAWPAVSSAETLEARTQRLRQYLYSYNSGVCVNGQPLTNMRAVMWRQLTGLQSRGSYWLTTGGYYGRAGYTAAGNIYSGGGSQSNRSMRNAQPVTHTAPRRSIISNRDTLYVPDAGILLPDGTSVTW